MATEPNIDPRIANLIALACLAQEVQTRIANLIALACLAQEVQTGANQDALNAAAEELSAVLRRADEFVAAAKAAGKEA